ncbi:hypothetical protein C7974DRAFT_379091 [Boeremia exigua]|uniref:uncharacterized protein n=1 Tax=Boeremia exigua TaxID=749465 RepID=UPI001E8EB767|nr:uncharacterized protein C7974DRAFT_379091 [Boeremia exigua]KAH6618963.1 hypothetical protein C7974DRAFT_379091 [Boeremia exigua]
MANHDYAASLQHERRKSLWATITRSLNLTTDWDSAPPLLAGLMEQFPGHQRTSLKSITTNSLQSGQSTTARHLHPNDFRDAYSQYYTDPTPAGRVYARSMRHRLSRQPTFEHSTNQRDDRRPDNIYEEPSTQQYPIMAHGSRRDTYSPECQPLNPLPLEAERITYHRNGQGQLIIVPQATGSIRRRPVQSSLRNQVNRDEIIECDIQSSHSQSTHNVIATASNPGGCSHPPIHSFNNQARVCTPRNLNAQPRLGNSLPSSNAAELQGSLKYDPPDITLPRASFTRRPKATHKDSTTSLATFENPDSSARPLNLLQANIVALKQHVKHGLGDYQWWRTQMIRLGTRVKYHSRLLWDTEDDRVKLFNARCDVWAFGPLLDCRCGVCVRKRGEDPATADRAAHDVQF